MSAATLTLCLLVVVGFRPERSWGAHLTLNSSYSSGGLWNVKWAAFIFLGHSRRKAMAMGRWRGLCGWEVCCLARVCTAGWDTEIQWDDHGNWISYVFWDISYFGYFGSATLMLRGMRKHRVSWMAWMKSPIHHLLLFRGLRQVPQPL